MTQVVPVRLQSPELNSRFRNAISRGLERRPAFTQLSGDSYEVDGRGDTYNVRFFISDGEVWSTCTCEAGQNGQPCYHVAYVAYQRGLSLTASRRYDAGVFRAPVPARAVETSAREIVLQLSRGQSFELTFDATVRIQPK